MNRRIEDFNKAWEDLSVEIKNELKLIGAELEELKDKKKKIDEKLKKQIAKICLKLINETPNDKTSIMETSFIITGNFVWYIYDDELDEVVDIAGELELPEEHVSGKVLKMWFDMKRKLEKYLE